LTGTPEVNWKKGFESVEYVSRNFPGIGHCWLVHVFALIWIWEFTLACHQFVISATVATWFFSRYFI